MDSLLHDSFYGLGPSEKRAYDVSVDLLRFVQPASPSSQGFAGFGRPGLLLALLGDPRHLHPGIPDAIAALRKETLIAAHQSLDTRNLLTALVYGCLGPPAVGCTVVLPSALAEDESRALALLREPGSHHLLAIVADRQADARLLVQDLNIPLWPIGRTTGQSLIIRRSEGPESDPFPTLLHCSLTDLQHQPPQP